MQKNQDKLSTKMNYIDEHLPPRLKFATRRGEPFIRFYQI